MNTQSGRTLFAAGLITATLASGAIGQQDEKLGKWSFLPPAIPMWQAEFNRGVAMLHSYWFLIARRKFEGISAAGSHLRDGILGCGDGLPRQHPGNHAHAGRVAGAWDALERARVVGTKTSRERDWIEALSAYFRDHDKVAGVRDWQPIMPRWSGCRKAIR